MSEDSEDDKGDNVGIALALVFGAGGSTAIGAAVVFFPSIVKLASKRVLAGSLGFSAGVMTYVSFVEIFAKSRLSFEDAGHDENKAYLYATLCFFAGVISMMLLNAGVSFLLGGKHDHDHEPHKHHNKKLDDESDGEFRAPSVDRNAEPKIACPCCSDDPVAQLQKLQTMGQVLEEEDRAAHSATCLNHTHHHESQSDGTKEKSEEAKEQEVDDEKDQNGDDDDRVEKTDKQKDGEAPHEPDEKLVRMGLNTAIAIGLHNFPEGLATFVAALNDPRVGAILAFAIAIHNIPEGLCVALPVYYATGNRTKAFLWALLSGASEFVAALLGWAILANSFSDDLYAVLFGLVAGMMVTISTRELLPTAHVYDPEDTVVTYSYIGGMALIAVSLVLFLL